MGVERTGLRCDEGKRGGGDWGQSLKIKKGASTMNLFLFNCFGESHT